MGNISEECVKKCDPCKTTKASLFQDSEYGKQMRVHTPLKKSKLEEKQRWRCTICGNLK